MISKAISPFHVLTRMVSKVISLSLYFVFLRSPRGHPIGAQRPVGTQTLLAKSSVLYLRARDRHTRPAAFRFFLLARREGMPCPTPIAATRVPPSGTPRFSSSYFHVLYPTNSIILGICSHFRMTANAFFMLLCLQEAHRYALRNKKISKKPQKVRKQDSKAPFPTHVNSRGRIWIRPHGSFHFSRFPHGYMEWRQIV